MKRLLILTLICANLAHGAASSSSSAAATSHGTQLTEINARIEILNSILANWPTTYEETSACLEQFKPHSTIWTAIRNNKKDTVREEIASLTRQRDVLLAQRDKKEQLKAATRTFNQSVQYYMAHPGSYDENALCQTLLQQFETAHQLKSEQCAQLAKTIWFIEFIQRLINENKRAMLQELRVITSANSDLHQAVDALLITPLDEPASSVSSTPAAEDPEMAAAIAASIAMQEQPVDDDAQLRMALERSTVDTRFVSSPSSEEEEEQQMAAALALSQQETQGSLTDETDEEDDEDDSDVDPELSELPQEQQVRIAIERSRRDRRFVTSPSTQAEEAQHLAEAMARSQAEAYPASGFSEEFTEIRPATAADQAEFARLNPELHAAFLAQQADHAEVAEVEPAGSSDEDTTETDNEEVAEQPTLSGRNLAIGSGILATVAAAAIYFLKK